MENRAKKNHARSNLGNKENNHARSNPGNKENNRVAENSMYFSRTYLNDPMGCSDELSYEHSYMNSTALTGNKLCVEVQSQYENTRIKSNIRTNLHSNVAVESIHYYDEPSIITTTPETREAVNVHSRSANDSYIRNQSPPTLHPRMRAQRPMTRHYARLRHSMIERLSKTSNSKIALVTLLSCLVGAGVAAGIICTLYYKTKSSDIRQNNKDESSSVCPPCADFCKDQRIKVANTTPKDIIYLCEGMTFAKAKKYCREMNMKLYDPRRDNKEADFISDCLGQGSKCLPRKVKYWTVEVPAVNNETCNGTTIDPDGGANKHRPARNCAEKNFPICEPDYEVT